MIKKHDRNYMNRRFQTAVVMLSLLLTTTLFSQNEKVYNLKSIDDTIELIVKVSKSITYSIIVDGNVILKQSQISMNLSNDRVLGENGIVVNVDRNSVNNEIRPVVPEKFSVIHDNYNELVLKFDTDYSVIFRVYNNGVAYRFKTSIKESIKVISENASFNFDGSNKIYFPEEKGFFSHNERVYKELQLETMSAGRLASLPFLISTSEIKVLITESALRDYPGMWIKTKSRNSLIGTFPPYSLESKLKPNSDRNAPVIKSADYIAETDGDRAFPWRIIAIAKNDGDLITNSLVYQLADKLEIKDPSWIKPGKVAWDWWNYNNIYGVDFKAGVNTETYKYFIDFASQYGIEYIVLDEGWYNLGNLLSVVPEINIEEIIAYGMQKNVEVILWVVWKTLDDQLEEAMNQFEKWGVAGIKVDFMQRDDQEIVNYYWKVAKEAAQRKMLVDYHGAYKPSGLRRAFPNVISREGVKGLENNKWSRDITPTHNLTIPFIRMVAGPMDYTPGSMLNAQPEMFRVIRNRPMSMGTRVHQIAMYIVYESPLQMLADSPSNYFMENESTQFISKIPTVWDDTHVIEASVGKYIVLARKNGNAWYIAAMTNENSREFTIDLSFLDSENYSVEIMQDGINADRYAGDYKKVTKTISKNDSLKIKLAPGGGWAAILDQK